jgi:TRAP-type C4-dicarboxylate transport system substrate-binding protein
MMRFVLSSAIGVLFFLAGSLAQAEPVKLKLAYMLSDRTSLFADAIKPFVDAVNSEAHGALEIEVYSSGVLGKIPAQQAQLVLDGTADIAFVLPGTSARFADNAVVELPGAYHGLREASMVYTRLAAAGALRGFSDFYAIATLATEPESIHARRKIASLDDLKGLKIRSSSPLEAAAFARLGIEPVIMPAPASAEAISSGAIDGAAVAPALLQEFGIGRVTSSHYMLRTSAGPLAVLMNRKTFDGLSPAAQNVIRRYSGEWIAARFADGYEKSNAQAIEQLKADARRKVVVPTAAELARAHGSFTSVIADWVAKDPHHQKLLQLANEEIAKYRGRRLSAVTQQ